MLEEILLYIIYPGNIKKKVSVPETEILTGSKKKKLEKYSRISKYIEKLRNEELQTDDIIFIPVGFSNSEGKTVYSWEKYNPLNFSTLKSTTEDNSYCVKQILKLDWFLLKK